MITESLWLAYLHVIHSRTTFDDANVWRLGGSLRSIIGAVTPCSTLCCGAAAEGTNTPPFLNGTVLILALVEVVVLVEPGSKLSWCPVWVSLLCRVKVRVLL